VNRREFLVAAPLTLAAVTHGVSAHGRSKADVLLARLQKLRPQIRAVTSYALDRRIETVIAVTPATLLTFPGVHVRRHADAATIDRCIRSLSAGAPLPSAELFDARWGLIFLGDRDAELFAAFADRFASHGQLAEQRVEFGSPMNVMRILKSVT